jgi:hypothetical protein
LPPTRTPQLRGMHEKTMSCKGMQRAQRWRFL